MKLTTENFTKLSAIQIKTFAALILMSTLSFQAMASTSEAYIEEELAIEDWMTTPFETSFDEVLPLENLMCCIAP